ncbi:integrase [Mycobacterium sp. MAA66]
MAPGMSWSDDRLVAVREDCTPLRPEPYTDESQRLRQRTGLERITLHDLRHTSGRCCSRNPIHVVAA